MSELNNNIILETNNLTKKYGYTFANDHISIKIERGEICGFVGKNGSGKTTFIRLITGLIKPTEGTFQLYGKNGKCVIGAVVEKPSFFGNMNAYQNLVYQSKLIGNNDLSIIDNLLVKVGLNTGPKDKKKVSNYSLGMRQRLGIAVALLGNSEFLILDEPTNGLDPEGIIEIRELLIDLAKNDGITILVSSHILSELYKLATSYCFINEGKIVKRIAAEDLTKNFKRRINIDLDKIEGIENVLQSYIDSNDLESFLIIGNKTIQLVNPINLGHVILGITSNQYDIINIESYNDDLEKFYINLVRGEKNEKVVKG